jgi:hypothetical protein
MTKKGDPLFSGFVDFSIFSWWKKTILDDLI